MLNLDKLLVEFVDFYVFLDIIRLRSFDDGVLFKLFLQQTDKIPHLDLVRQELLTKRKETLVP